MGSPRGCFSFSKLNDQGLVGGCEGDIDSTLTLLLFDYAFYGDHMKSMQDLGQLPGFKVVEEGENA